MRFAKLPQEHGCIQNWKILIPLPNRVPHSSRWNVESLQDDRSCLVPKLGLRYTMPAMSKISCAATGAAALMAASAFVAPQGTQTRRKPLGLWPSFAHWTQSGCFAHSIRISHSNCSGCFPWQANSEGRSPTGGAEVHRCRSWSQWSLNMVDLPSSSGNFHMAKNEHYYRL